MLMGISGVMGLLQWFPAYTIDSGQLNTIVICNMLFGAAAVFCCFYSLIKKKASYSAVMLAILVLQLISVYQLGFLTFV